MPRYAPSSQALCADVGNETLNCSTHISAWGRLEPSMVRGRSQSRWRYRERQLPGIEAYSHCRPLPAVRGRQLSITTACPWAAAHRYLAVSRQGCPRRHFRH